MKTFISAIVALLLTSFGTAVLAVDPLNIGLIKGNTVKLNVPINKLDTIQGHFLQQGRTLLYRIDDTDCQNGQVVLRLSPTIYGQVSSATVRKSFNALRLPNNKKLICNPMTQ